MPILDSSSLLAVDYLAERKVLRVTFRESGKTFDYQSVPVEVFDGLMAAESKGSWFNEHVRDNYRFEPVRGPVRIL
jgi:hypothetical protein